MKAYSDLVRHNQAT